ncbi:MAG: catalase-related domain-containing protein, partial [Solibacillus sp.]
SRQAINVGRVSYHKNSLANNSPTTSTAAEGGFVNYEEKVEGRITRERSKSFADHFSQARLFWNSMSPPEKQHIINAFSFEVGKVNSRSVRQQVVDMFVHVDKEMATIIAKNVGVNKPSGEQSNVTASSPALSQANTIKLPQTLKVGVLIGNGFDAAEVNHVLKTLSKYGVRSSIIAERIGAVESRDGVQLNATETYLTMDSVLFDALYVVGVRADNQAKFNQDVLININQAFRHYKPIGVARTGMPFLQASSAKVGPGIVVATGNNDFAEKFVEAIAMQRFWDRDIY